MKFTAALVALFAGIELANAHGLLTVVNGANGVSSQGFAINPSTPRDTGSPRTAEGDTSVIRDDTCGKTKDAGQTDIATQLSLAESSGLASAGPNGEVSMTIHQVNQDGAGPYKMEVSPSAQGGDWVTMDVTQNVPGKILGLSTAVAQDFPVSANIPAGTTCTGGSDGATCLVRVKNAAVAGPFGGCGAVTQASGTTAAAGSTTSSAAKKRDNSPPTRGGSFIQLKTKTKKRDDEEMERRVAEYESIADMAALLERAEKAIGRPLALRV